MDKKQTGALQIITDQAFTEKELVINPNDGFDLGLMMTEATVELEFHFKPGIEKKDPLIAQVIQKNECKLGTLELGNKSARRLNGTTKVRLTIEDKEGYPKLIISRV